MPSCTQLAHVVDRSPLLLPLRAETKGETNVFCTVVKIRPTLVHFLVDGRVSCVIRSKAPIMDIADFSGTHAPGESRRLLVAVADGNVWIVTLPLQLQSLLGAGLKEFVLERSSCEEVQWFYHLPGVLSVQHIQAGSTSFTLVRSVVTPSTLIVSTRRSSESKLQTYQSLELTDLEGEQSTCSICLNSEEPRETKLLQSLFPEVANDAGVVAMLQGDLDGSVRFSLIRHSYNEKDGTKVSTICSGTLFRLNQPVQMIIPFTSSPCSLSPSTRVTSVVPDFDALLFLGSRGRVKAVLSRRGCSVDTVSGPTKKLDFRQAIQSLAFVSSLGAFVLCSNGLAFVFCSTAVLLNTDLEDSKAMSNDHAIRVEKMNFRPGIVRLETHGIVQSMSILFVSGRVVTMDKSSLCENTSSVLPPLERLRSQKGLIESTSASRVRHLLHRIAHTSTESSALRVRSSRIDNQLKTLHSSLELLRLVKGQGVTNVITCEVGASVAETGTYLDRRTIKLVGRLHFANAKVIASLDEWWLCMYVRTRECAVTAYSFPLNDVLTRQQQSIILDPETIAQQDQGCLWVSCAMIFCPTGDLCPETKHSEADCIRFRPISPDIPSFAVPLLHDRILLAQLSRPVEEETSASQVSIHSVFRQNHESFMPVGRTSNGCNTSSSALRGGVQWWAALADHAQKSASFASLWSKIAPPDAPSFELSPPSRFVISIPAFFEAEGEDEDIEDIDEDLEEVRVERIVLFLRQVFNIHGDEVPRLRRSCRTQHGKLWTVLQSISGSLILLRFIPCESDQRSVDLTIQCSDLADLSAIRALILEAIDEETERETSAGELVLDMSEMLDPVATLDNLLEELTRKTITSIVDPQSAVCTDEVLHALSQLAHLETQTLTLYWKTRSQRTKPSHKNTYP